jgi:hypothetical protein
VSNAEEVFDDVNMSGKEWTVADEDPPDEAFGEAGLEFTKTDVKMMDISSLQFAHIRGGSLVEVRELSREEFGQSDEPVPAKVKLRLTWTIAWEEVNKAGMPRGKFGQVGEAEAELDNEVEVTELSREKFDEDILSGQSEGNGRSDSPRPSF